MASVLWLDFEGVVVEAGLTDAIIAEFGTHPPAEGADGSERSLAAAIATIEAPREEVESRVRELTRLRPGFEELVGWAQWHGWLPIVISTAPDVCVETVLEDPGFDRVTRHCGRTRQVYRWRLTYASPRGVELEEGFLLSYAAALRDAGDLVVYVGEQVGGEQAAGMAFASCTGGALREALDEGERAHGFTTLDDVREVLEQEGEAWKAAFASGRG
ncbi:MAG: hypothetical protein F4Y97_01010 [Dehalococcoidia bacterium]|nr:hypothetical protein [Dehalococcoidia bacterium]